MSIFTQSPANGDTVTDASGNIWSYNSTSNKWGNSGSSTTSAETIRTAATDPLTQVDGTALEEGDIYYNTADNAIKAYDGASWAAVGGSSSGSYATGGLSWLGIPSGTTQALFDVAHDGSQFVITGSGKILTSPDGLTWTSQTVPALTGDLRGVAHNGSLWVAVGGADYSKCHILTSPDGVTWTAQTSPISAPLYGVAYGGGQWVAVGGDGSFATGQILTSPDGVTWTSRTSGLTDRVTGVAYNGSLWVAVSLDSSKVLTSTDAITWTVQAAATASGDGVGKLDVIYDGSQWVIVCYSGRVVTSPDGVTWTTRLVTGNDLYGVAHNGSQYVAVGNYGRIVTSTDGVAWVQPTSGVTGSTILYGAASDGSQWVAVGESGIILVG